MKGRNYRRPEGMPYVRREYIDAIPGLRIAKFTMGKLTSGYDYILRLISESKVQVRQNALEAARVGANKIIEKVGEDNYFLRLVPFPHVILRENKMIATAGADRLSEGMRRAFGKPIGLAARIEPGDTVIELYVKKEYLDKAKEALRIAKSKLPMKTRLEIIQAQPSSS
ncbi:MAG: 50S ribosomal protein L16 [Nitrososphaeria archaeon]|nr:50S ribosomal protein L16 [Nitrososphaerota archaeon]